MSPSCPAITNSRRAKTFDPRNLASETFIGISEIPRVLRGAVNSYLKRSGIKVAPRFGIDNFAMAMSLVASERGVALLPISIEAYLPPSIVSRRLKGEQPTVDLMIGYRKGNASPILKTFLSRIDGLIGCAAMAARKDAEVVPSLPASLGQAAIAARATAFSSAAPAPSRAWTAIPW